MLIRAHKIAERFNLLPEVEAVALGGSLATERADEGSDIDLYVFSDRTPSPQERERVIGEVERLELGNDFFGTGDEWIENGVHIDAIYWTTAWVEGELERVLIRHQALMGYSTAFWHTVRVSQPLFDRCGWYAGLQRLAAVPYPEALRRNIIAKNHAFLRGTLSSYVGSQLTKAVKRNDRVTAHHRVTAVLESLFDILFAVNRLPHPGEKHMLSWAEGCERVPEGMREHVENILDTPLSEGEVLLRHVHALLDSLDTWLRDEGLL